MAAALQGLVADQADQRAAVDNPSVFKTQIRDRQPAPDCLDSILQLFQAQGFLKTRRPMHGLLNCMKNALRLVNEKDNPLDMKSRS